MMLFEWPLHFGKNVYLDKDDSLRISAEDLRGLVPGCLGGAPNLRCFRFCPGKLLPSGFFRHFVQKCPHVEVVVVDCCDPFTTLPELKELNALKLKELRLRGVFNHLHVSKGFEDFLRGQTELRILDLRGQSFISPLIDFPFPLDLLDVVSRECPNISEIYIDVGRQHLPLPSVISSFGFSFGNEVLKFTVHDDQVLQDLQALCILRQRLRQRRRQLNPS